MNDQNPTNEVASEALHVAPLSASDATQLGKPPIQTLPPRQQLIEKIKTILISMFEKLYSNKIMFWSLTSFLGIVLLIVIVGSLFGHPGSKVIPNHLPTATPFILATPVASSSSDVVSTSQEKLLKLKNQLDQLDIKQERLTPPNLNFDIKF